MPRRACFTRNQTPSQFGRSERELAERATETRTESCRAECDRRDSPSLRWFHGKRTRSVMHQMREEQLLPRRALPKGTYLGATPDAGHRGVRPSFPWNA